MFRQDPGPCPICGTAHSACRADPGPITMVQLPQRDAAMRLEGLQAEVIQATLPPGQVTSGTYRRGPQKGRP